MRERPILFNGLMVRALLEGRKTQTRRIVKPVRGYEHNSMCRPDLAAESWAVWWHSAETERVGCLQECPYGVPGDRLWVRETFAPSPDGPIYRATKEEQGIAEPGDEERWTPSIFMRRRFSRITLEVAEVRVQRLQEISEEDAEAEGLIEHGAGFLGFPKAPWQRHATDAYRNLWESINGPGSWTANPYVWAITFRRLEGGMK